MPGVRRYELLEKIAAGGMAEVYLAEAHAPDGTKRRLVIKKILPHYSADPDYRRMFMDEAKIAGSLDHPNVVKVLDLGRMDDQLFIALELVAGKDLQQVLRAFRAARTTVPLDSALYVTAEVLRALDHAHTRTASGRPLKIVHRDVTPQNVLVSADAEVKVTDFGVARAAVQQGKTVAGVIKGNVRYMAPEQIVSSKDVDHRADVYAAGMLLHALVSGKHPFEDDTLLEAIDRCVEGKVPKPSEIQPGVPPVIDATVMKAVALDRNRRYQSAAEFLAAIEQLTAPRRALDVGRTALAGLMRGLEVPAVAHPRALSIVSRLGPLIAEAAKEGAETVYRTTGRMVNPDLLPKEAEAAAAKKTAPPFELTGHVDGVAALAAFPDAKRLVSASLDHTLRIWTIASKSLERTLRGHTSAAICCAVSGDGRSILSGGRDNRVRLWGTERGDLVRTFEGHDGWVLGVAFGPDGSTAASAGMDKTVRVWDLATRACLHTLTGHHDAVAAVAFTPDGKWLISASHDGTIGVWDLAAGALRRSFEGECAEGVRALSLSPDGTTALTGGGDGVVRVWDVKSGVEIGALTGHREALTGVAISRNLKLAVSAGHDATARLWAVEPGVSIRTFDTPGPALALTLGPDLRWMATAGSSRLITVFPL